MPKSGTFGIIGPRYAITDEKVVVARRWIVLWLGLALPAGLLMIVRGYTPGHDATLGGFGIVVALVGIVGILASPIRPPSSIAIVPGAMLASGQRYARPDVGTIEVKRRDVRSRWGFVLYREWSIEVTLLSMKTFAIKLQRGGEHAPQQVIALRDAMRATLAG
jgi:hypothetical protein